MRALSTTAMCLALLCLADGNVLGGDPVPAASSPQPAFDLIFDKLNDAGTVPDRSGHGRDGVLKGGAKIVQTARGPALELDGKTGGVLVKNSGVLDPKRGLTLVITLRSDAFRADKDSTHMNTHEARDMFLFKQETLLLGRRGPGYISSGGGGQQYKTRGTARPLVWEQLACVIQRIDEPSTGKRGYQRSLYLNGKRFAEEFAGGEMAVGAEPWLVGTGLTKEADLGQENIWCWGGKIARARVFETALTPGQMVGLAVEDRYLDALAKPRVFAGIAGPEIKARLDRLVTAAEALGEGENGARAAWLAAALRKLGGYGPPAKAFSAEMALAERTMAAGAVSPDEWNAKSALLKLFANERLGAAVRVDPTSSQGQWFGLYDLTAKREVLGFQQELWRMDLLADGDRPASRLDDLNAAVASQVESLGRDSFRIVWTTRGETPRLTARSTFTLKGARIEVDFAVDNASSAILDEATEDLLPYKLMPVTYDPVPFTPDPAAATVPREGLRLWLRSDSGVTRDADGRISVWRDLSGNGYDATAAGEARPSLETKAISQGLPALRFDGNVNEMNCGKGLGMPMPGPFTVALVLAPRGLTKNRGVFAINPGDGYEDFASLRGLSVSFPQANTIGFCSGGYNTLTSVGGEVPAKPAHPLAVTFVRPGRAEETVRSYADGALVRQETVEETTPANAPRQNAGFHLGGRQLPHENTRGKSDLHEVLVWDRVLTDAELKSLHSYLLLPRTPLAK